MTSAIKTAPRASAILLRIIASLLGGYLFTWGVATFGITVLVAFGVGYDSARSLLMMIAFLVFLVVFLWAFAVEKLSRAWLILVGGGSVLCLAAWLLQAFILRGTA